MGELQTKFSIAIDGTAASGKSTVARLLSDELGCSYLDTGKLYRAVALHFIASVGDRVAEWGNGSELKQRLSEIDLRLHNPGRGECRILLDGEDINDRLSDLDVEKATPFAARLPEVREFLLDLQRDLAKRESVVMAGRDIGTVVLPDATLKVFIEADLIERARRRLGQHRDTFTDQELELAAEELGRRDERDANREHAPMIIAPDALPIDSTNSTPAELVAEITARLKERLTDTTAPIGHHERSF